VGDRLGLDRGARVDGRTTRQPPREDRALIARFAAIALFSTGCVLVVSPKRYGDHCVFAGATTSQCGDCLAQNCAAAIDAACDDTRTMAAVDSCSDKHDCFAIEALAPAEGAVERCLAKSCAAVCRTLTHASQTSCAEPSLSEGHACKCTGGAATNDFVCDPQAYPDTICCAPATGWPADGVACTCAPLACTDTKDGCACRLTTIAPSNPTCGGGSTVGACCADQDSCSCRPMGCYDFEKPVTHCGVETIGAVMPNLGCAKGQVRVSSCSRRSP
jgi:hypothetical protein